MYSLTFMPFFYVIFWKNASPWWFLLAALMANCTSSPSAWGLSGEIKKDVEEKISHIITDDKE
jgi:hypothetical protein